MNIIQLKIPDEVDLKARKLASRLNLKFTGTLGVMNKAKQIGVLEKVKPIIE